jgi:hypothetical protein
MKTPQILAPTTLLPLACIPAKDARKILQG